MSKNLFKTNKDKREATIRRIEIIGEAVKNIPSSLKSKYPEVAWKEIVGTRDKMIHHYFGVDIDIVWDIIKENLPVLKKQILRIKKELENHNKK